MTVDTATDPLGNIKPMWQINGLDEYLQSYGPILGKKAIHALNPLHVPGRDDLPDFDDLLREPFPCQQHVIAAAMKMMDNVGSGFIVGEMGTGKTLLGMSSVHKHACRSRKQGGKGGKYRAIVLCPDHLIGKWCREIEETIPDAIVARFGPQGAEEIEVARAKKRAGKAEKQEAGSRRTLRDVLAMLDKREGHRWEKPAGAEWYVLGRNQAKWLSDWVGIADVYRGFNGRMTENSQSSKHVVVDRVAVMNEHGRQTYDRFGRPETTNITSRVHYCPSCGTVVKDKKGVPLSTKELSVAPKNSKQQKCKGLYLQMLPNPDKAKQHGIDRLCPIPEEVSARHPGQEINHGGRRWVVKACNEPLYNYVSQPYRWSPARVIQKKMKRLFGYLIIDEVHEQKSDESAQSMACGKLIASVDHTLALTGTIIGGYADHLYPLMMRLSPTTLRDEGFEWGKDLAFSEVYGRIDRIVSTKEDGGESEVGSRSKSMRRAKGGTRNERKAVRPGVMPTMFGRHMIGSSMFITLEELADELPDLFEYVGGPLPAPPARSDFPREEEYLLAKDRYDRMAAGYVDCAVSMEPEQREEYLRVQGILESVNRDLLQKGSMKALGAYLWTTTDYPDRPFGWDHDPEVKKAYAEALREREDSETRGDEVDRMPELGHTVGYWEKPGDRRIENFRGVVTPRSLPEDVIYPKEQALIDICKKQKKDGIQTWVYVQMTGKRNIQPRLKSLLEVEGLRVGVLRANDVEPIEREEWIQAHGRDFDVMISHPQLVSTGLDLFSKKEGGHNYATIVFYETGYNLFTMRQAARRAWRIGQPRDCRVYYLYYKETMQHKAMALMSKKMAAAQALEGEFSEDGLAAMAGEDNVQMAMARNLSERIDPADMQRSWGKVKSGGKKKINRPTDAIKEITVPNRRLPWPMPRVKDLIEMTDEMRRVFMKIAASPDLDWNAPLVACSEITLSKLESMGLVTLGKDMATVRCKLSGHSLESTLTWLELYPAWTGIHMPLGLVVAKHPERGEHYVSILMNGEEPIGMGLKPVNNLKDRGLLLDKGETCLREISTNWSLVSASPEDEAAIKATGFTVAPPPASKLDSMPIELQLAAEGLLAAEQRRAEEKKFRAKQKKTAPTEELDPAALATKALSVYNPGDDFEEDYIDDLPELTEDVLTKMFANMMANGLWDPAQAC